MPEWPNLAVWHRFLCEGTCLAKKKVSKKKTTKKTGTRKASGASGAAGKKTTTKKAAKKTAKKVTKKVTKKKVTKKKVTKKTAPAKTTKKKAAKATSKQVAKKTAKKVAKKSATSKKATTKAGSEKVSKKKVTKKSSEKTSQPVAAKSGVKVEEPAKGTAQGASSSAGSDSSKTTKKKRSSKSKKPALVMPTRPLLLGPNGPSLKPLIPSGKNNQQTTSVLDNVTSRRTKTPLTKTQLDKYRMILLQRRAELLGDVRNLEDEALRSDSGRSSHNTKNSDDAGSESYEQSVNLNLAASERERIIEIDAALERIENRTYGLCELTFEPISKARLDEIPWARYTIDAARELDRRGGAR